jgi:hypothetical protein
MVPHVKVEEKLHEAAGVTEITFAVTGLPDPRKGERLVVLHTLPEDRLPEVWSRLARLGLPNLWIPRTDQYFHVDTLPRLASGKMDLRRIRDLATQFVAEGGPRTVEAAPPSRRGAEREAAADPPGATDAPAAPPDKRTSPPADPGRHSSSG